MIPRDFITEWRVEAPWIDDRQVEQDLVISRALVEIFSDELLRSQLAFRGGTALYKLFLRPAARYSEDIDLVQIEADPAGDLMDRFHAVLDPWLGKPRYKQTEGRVTFTYRFGSEETPPVQLKLKVEINTREHFSVYGTRLIPFGVQSRWFEGGCDIPSYGLNELLGTKLRALYQRKKGRDLFDLDVALQHKDANSQEIIAAFRAYMDHGGHAVTRQQLQDNLTAKLEDPDFNADISALLRSDFEWDLEGMAKRVSAALLDQME
ncbi:nucleotidyl transferase AbiEii/AbiGii toxin family protein [Nitratireductor sp. XY-223]|uniref:nucleotidyl transferase AbiEii/AbiGii toxin family protein n=1 Tax=Nitratireductor sp. XY-223 TaxID=2561926 RepID=UPI0010AB0DA1|nr:nucleotidyl transferase AbiEii/AbiGii toxin family protein [Nitratireductor sp. XY-223]